MAGPLASALFWVAAVAALVAHLFILRSTVRGIRALPAGSHTGWEWAWAVLPLMALLVLLVATWVEMHPSTLTFPLPAGRVLPGSIGS